MMSIGWRFFRRGWTKMAIVIFGVVFAVVLLTMEVGMLLALVDNASLLVNRSRADIWVSTLDVQTFEFATPISSSKKYQIEAIPGVNLVEEFIISYSIWKLPQGGNSYVQVIGLDPKGKLFAPLNLVEGRMEDLHNQDAVIIDRAERGKLGGVQLGDTTELMYQKAKVVGFTEDMKAFTTNPYVFTSLKRARQFGWITAGDGQRRVGDRDAIYFLIRVTPGSDPEEVCSAIEAAIPGVDAHLKNGLAWRTEYYWMMETGVGMGFVASALIGLIVGTVIVSQTLYGMTIERIGEYGVMKALGASMSELARVVLEQSLICGVLGFLVGSAISAVAAPVLGRAGTSVHIPIGLTVFVAILTALLCIMASLASIARLRSLEPAMVFRV